MVKFLISFALLFSLAACGARVPTPLPVPPTLALEPTSAIKATVPKVWLTDFGGNALVRFDPVTASFDSIPLPVAGAAVRQLLGRPGEVWGAESGLDKLVVIRSAP